VSPPTPPIPNRPAPPATARAQQAPSDVIPRFYFPSGVPLAEPQRLQALQKVDQLFAAYPQGMPADAFKEVVGQVRAL
jgi:hypothetical protein